MDVFSLRDSIVAEYRKFATSFTTIHAQDIRAQIEAIYAEGRFWPDPLIQINPSYTQLGLDIEESYARQDQIREEQRAAISRFSARFDYIVRAIIGDKVTGRIDTSGRSLSLTVEEHGKRESAAIETVKLLAFDLAAVMTSIEGDGSFPRFLIHDGPREADMAPDVYERLFLFAYELEKCFEGEPSFQYILTTTTRPPDKFVAAPWLRLQLAGIPAEERFLRRDL